MANLILDERFEYVFGEAQKNGLDIEHKNADGHIHWHAWWKRGSAKQSTLVMRLNFAYEMYLGRGCNSTYRV